MNEKRAIEVISELQDQVNKLTMERNNYASMLINCEEFLKKIPRSLPNSKSKTEFTVNQWLEWAKEKLGYEISK